MKIISLIIPVYNVEPYLARCIDSCLNQDIQHDKYEIILVNDGSTDNSLQIIKEYKAKYPFIKVINQENQGLSDAKNNGLDIATGKYIWFIDSDDHIAVNCLGTLVKMMDEKNLDALKICPIMDILVKSKFENTFPADFSDKNISDVYDGESFITDSGLFDVAAWGIIFNRDFWQKNKFRFHTRLYGEDSQLIPYAVSKSNRIAALLDCNAYNYINRPNSLVCSPMNIFKIKGEAIISRSHYSYAKESTNKKLKSYYFKSASDWYMVALLHLANIKASDSEINEILSTIGNRPIPRVKDWKMLIYRLWPTFFPRSYIKFKRK